MIIYKKIINYQIDLLKILKEEVNQSMKIKKEKSNNFR